MWSSTVGFVNGKHRYLTAETFGFKINSNGQLLKKRQQWTIEPFPENLGPDGSISSAASVSSQCVIGQPTTAPSGSTQQFQLQPSSPSAQNGQQLSQDSSNNNPCILTFSSGPIGASLTSIKSSSNGSSSSAGSDQDACGEEHENVAIKSHLNKYLAVDSYGNVTCDSDEKTENARFTITICSMSQARSKDEHIFWAFKNVERGYYLGTTEDGMICCNAKMPKSRAELWHIHLIPARGASFFALKSLGRKRFGRVVYDESITKTSASSKSSPSISDNSIEQHPTAQVQLDSTISWGPETLFQFKYYEGGRYSLLTSDCLYLTNEGQCIPWKAGDDDSNLPPAECLFTLEYHSGFLAFRDSFSHYLAAAGRSSVLRSRSMGVSRDELFVFESAPIQVSLKATFNNRWVSIRQGVDLSANQADTSLRYETFQLTYHKQTQNWSVMTQECNFWTVSHNTSTISVCKPGDYEGLTRGQFKLVWSDSDATCMLKFVDANRHERWITARRSGQLFLASGNQDPVKFIMRFQNRRLLSLRPVDGSGFVGLKTNPQNSRQLEANKTSPDSIAIEYADLTNLTPATCINQNEGLQCPKPAPGVGPKQVSLLATQQVEQSSQPQQTINMFNVRLNSTKMGQNVLERFNGSENTNHKGNKSMTRQDIDHRDELNEIASKKEIECLVFDDDNNNCQPHPCGPDFGENGGVESEAAPSVASIINTFSNMKVTNGNGNVTTTGVTTNVSSATAQNNHQPMSAQNRANSSVFKLASNFGVSTTAGQPHLQPSSNLEALSDAASVITSCSSIATASNSSVSSANSSGSTIEPALASGKQIGASSDQVVAQLECCYLKLTSIGRYLIVGDDDGSVICDATNKACAQPWIIELRTHSSIAIRASDNHAYLQLGTNGTILLSRCEPSKASLWEF